MSIVGIFKTFMLSWVEHEQFYNMGTMPFNTFKTALDKIAPHHPLLYSFKCAP